MDDCYIKSIQKEKFDLNNELLIKTIINYSNDTIYFKDKESKFILVGKAQADRFGIDDPQKAIGKCDFDFFPEDQARKAFEDEQRIIKTGNPILGKIEHVEWSTGNFSWMSSSKYPLYDLQGNIIGTWGVSRDITLQKQAEDELERLNSQLKEVNQMLGLLSIKDSLSNLYNHRYCFEIINKEFDTYSRRLENGVLLTSSIIMMDIDFFKRINDEHGHMVGDIVIRKVADIIKANIRKTDIAFRFGGDEFVVFLQDSGVIEAKKTAEKIRKMLAQTYYPINDKNFNITASLGVASFNEADNANQLFEIADKRLYISKESGRNRVT